MTMSRMEGEITNNIGVDLHKTQFTVFARHGKGLYRKYGTNAEGYNSFLHQLQEWRDEGYQIRLAVESTGNTRYFKRQFSQAG